MQNAQPKLLQVGHFKLYSGYAGVIFSLRESYIAAAQQLYYIRLQNCPEGNITCAANITAKQYNSPKANITEKDSDCITIRVFFWYTGRDSNPQPSEPESDALSIEPPVHLTARSLYQGLPRL